MKLKSTCNRQVLGKPAGICCGAAIQCGTVCRRPAIMAALKAAAAGSVRTHVMMMFRKRDQSTLSRDLTRPVNTIEPTLQWVLLIGRPMLDATSTVSADPISIQKPLLMETDRLRC